MEIIPRTRFNNSFTERKYLDFLDSIERETNHRPPFRIAETPIFVGRAMKKKLFEACDSLTDVIVRPDFKEKTQGALRPEYDVPGETAQSLFLQYDFGICQEKDGTLVPKLIEAQGFPTLYFYQDLVADKYSSFFDVPEDYTHLFGGLDRTAYKKLLRKVIIGNHPKENVVLLELEPEKQPTQIDFLLTTRELGIPTLCISDLKVSGREVYYTNKEGRKVQVHRIYNRTIFDELVGRNDIQREFHFTEDYDVEWAGHPNWFFRISKYTLPLFGGPYVPKTYFLEQLDSIPEDLENYVLKPLYSFSGSGVIYNVTPEHFEAIERPENFILQEKVNYYPVIQAPDAKVKCEIRILMIWEDGTPRPIIVNNLARLSRGEMIGVKYNKDKTWVGGSVAFFESGI